MAFHVPFVCLGQSLWEVFADCVGCEARPRRHLLIADCIGQRGFCWAEEGLVEVSYEGGLGRPYKCIVCKMDLCFGADDVVEIW